MQLEKNGKVITNITKTKTSIIIEFDDEKIKVSEEAFEQLDLYIGKTMSDKDIEQVIDLTGISKGLLYVYGLLKRRVYSKQEIKNKLYSKKLKTMQILTILKILEDKKLLNDELVKSEYLELCEIKCLGKIRIIKELKAKGIELDDSAFTYENEVNKAIVQIKRIYPKLHKDSYKAKTIKIVAALKYLGFEENVIQEAVKQIPEKDIKEEIENLKKELEKAILRNGSLIDNNLLKTKVIKSLMSKGYELNDIIRIVEVTIYENDS